MLYTNGPVSAMHFTALLRNRDCSKLPTNYFCNKIANKIACKLYRLGYSHGSYIILVANISIWEWKFCLAIYPDVLTESVDISLNILTLNELNEYFDHH